VGVHVAVLTIIPSLIQHIQAQIIFVCGYVLLLLLNIHKKYYKLQNLKTFNFFTSCCWDMGHPQIGRSAPALVLWNYYMLQVQSLRTRM